MNLPDFKPLKITQRAQSLTRATLDACDHAIVIAPKHAAASTLDRLPRGAHLVRLLKRAVKNGESSATSRIDNGRGTGVTVAAFDAKSTHAALGWARRTLGPALHDKASTVAVAVAGLPEEAAGRALLAMTAAAQAAAFDLPTYKTTGPDRRTRLRALRLLAPQSLDLTATAATALGNNVARWFTALPPNVLTASTYRAAIESLAAERSLRSKFYGEAELRKLGAGAFLAVAQGNAARDAGILRVSYRPARAAGPPLALVGKGILFDTGGTNLKTFKGMLDMHTDMQGSAVALGTLLALVELEAPYAIDAWLAITENRLSGTAYKSQDVVHAVNGTSIQVIHTDAEGRMVLADTLALAAREKPSLIVDYATLTGACVGALTERYSGVFTNRIAANQTLVDAGTASGERVWPFPMDADFDDDLKSDIADVKQCAVETYGDHILAARFLSRFVPADVPWVHIDLSAGQHKGGLAHIPSEITGFGVRLTVELLRGGSPVELAERLSN